MVRRMANVVIYVMAKQNVEAKKDEILLGDAASVYCEDSAVRAKANALCIYKFRGGQEARAVISMMKIIEMLTVLVPGATVESIGEKAIVLEKIPEKKYNSRLIPWKIALVAAVSFFGTAFTIMAFHNDVGVSDVFMRIYEMVTGQKSSGCTALEIFYSIGLCLGIIIFYNHIGGRRITKDPTPLEVEMKIYEQNVNMTLVETAEREGKEIDVD
ncbi:MAG: stage V sporulation protein AA [Lachnospiraceae bacterium]|nr:stage V sporulation protein AA [Lachnospiraceae bacterium]